MDTQKDIDEILSNCLGVRVRLIARAMSALYDKVLESEGLTISQLALLAAIGKAGSCSPSKLGTVLQLERSTVSRNLDGLMEAGLVRAGSTDGKGIKDIELTAAGYEKIASAMPKWRVAQQQAGEMLGDAGATVLRKVADDIWPEVRSKTAH